MHSDTEPVILALAAPACNVNQRVRYKPGCYRGKKHETVRCFEGGKNTGYKYVKETSRMVAISEERTNTGKELSNAADSGILAEMNTMTCINSTSLKNTKGSQESSVILRVSSVDEIIPCGIDEQHQRDYIGALQHGATIDNVLIKSSLLSITSALDNPGDATEADKAATSMEQDDNPGGATEADMAATSMEQDIGHELCERSLVVTDSNVDLLPAATSFKATGHDHQLSKDNVATIMDCTASCVVPAANVSTTENHKGMEKNDMGEPDHHGSAVGLPDKMAAMQHASADGPFSTISLPAFRDDTIITESSTKKLATDEQHGVSEENQDSPMAECAAQSGQSIDKSALIQLFPSMSNSTEAELDNRLTTPEDAEGASILKCVASRTHDSCCSLLQKFTVVHASIIANQPSDSLTVENLPFLKTLPMWAHIEEMEIFKKLPQRPHFRPLKQVAPELCEGMAIGLMLTFAKLAENIKGLNIHDDNALFEDKTKVLCLLEEHGFDTMSLRSRLETLLHIKSSRTELHDAIKKLEEQIALEISRLKTEACALELTCLSAEQHFSSIVAAPW